ncbi:MAG: hypothetical protein M9894_35880 [Planctomycetes bacterium]|nr:hypothetical protein [Planctomycetota bacterium]
MTGDERLARFLERHALPEREAVRADAAPYVDLTPEERGRHLAAACRAAADAVRASPFREAILARRDPPHPSYAALVRRLRRRARPDTAA